MGAEIPRPAALEQRPALPNDGRGGYFWYPGAISVMVGDKLHSAPGTLAQRRQVLIHCTVGPTAKSAINTFVASKRRRDGGSGLVSSHFVVDRDEDSTIYQCVPLCDTAYHASQANLSSVGIEVVGIPVKLMATEGQYAATAKLIAWTSRQLGIPCDRAHVRTHNEASPADLHTLCCTGVVDIERLVKEASGD